MTKAGTEGGKYQPPSSTFIAHHSFARKWNEMKKKDMKKDDKEVKIMRHDDSSA